MAMAPFDITSKMPFGKHRGLTIEEIPSDYLYWAIANLKADDIVVAMQREMSYREANDVHFTEGGECLPRYGEDFGGTGRKHSVPPRAQARKAAPAMPEPGEYDDDVPF